MISRILVPKDARLSSAQPNGVPRRLSSHLDERSLIPPDLPQFELDPRTSIPEHLPLDVLSARVVVPRNMPKTPLDATRKTPEYVHLDILESRVAVPSDTHPQAFEAKAPVAIQDLPDVLDPGVITTGEVNLLPAHVEERSSAWTGSDKVSLIGLAASLAVEISILLIIIFAPPLSHQVGTNEIARDNFTDLYLPPDVKDLTRQAPRAPSPQIRIDPRVLRNLAPSVPFSPPPGPVAPQPAVPQLAPQLPAQAPPLPAAPKALTSASPPAVAPDNPIRAPQQDTSNGLILPRFSPGKALQESLHEALRDGGNTEVDGPVRPIPAPGGVPRGGGGGGGGQGFIGDGLQLLTPTEGVDFTGYLQRMKAVVERNWYAVMPESAQLGERGRVILQFRVMRNGVVPEEEPAMVSSSTKEPLDRAAVSSIRASTPFEPLPPAFRGPFIELRFIFLYNLPLDTQ